MSEKRMVQIISLGFALQCLALSVAVGHREGHSALWWECVVVGALGFVAFLLVTFIKKRKRS